MIDAAVNHEGWQTPCRHRGSNEEGINGVLVFSNSHSNVTASAASFSKPTRKLGGDESTGSLLDNSLTSDCSLWYGWINTSASTRCGIMPAKAERWLPTPDAMAGTSAATCSELRPSTLPAKAAAASSVPGYEQSAEAFHRLRRMHAQGQSLHDMEGCTF